MSFALAPHTTYDSENIPNIQRFAALVGVLRKSWWCEEPKKRVAALRCLYRAVERYKLDGLGSEAEGIVDGLREEANSLETQRKAMERWKAQAQRNGR